MNKIVTKWTYIDYALEEPIDYTMLFSEEIDDGWEFVSLSSAIDTYRGNEIIILTALLSM